MLEKVDSGKIVAIKMFPIPQSCDHIQLINLCIGQAVALLAEKLPTLINQEEMVYCPHPWGSHKTTKAQFALMCLLPLDISEPELNKRLLAFGAGDGISTPYLMHENARYTYQITAPSTPVQTIRLHNKIFALEGK
jgi:hypothetical protein